MRCDNADRVPDTRKIGFFAKLRIFKLLERQFEHGFFGQKMN